MSSTNVPISFAARKGVSALAEMSRENRVALTSHGRVVAVVDSPERVDEQAAQVRAAAWAVVEAAADLTAGRSLSYSLNELCERAGVDVERVRERAHQLRTV